MSHWTQHVTIEAKDPKDAKTAAVLQGVIRHALGEAVTPAVDRAIAAAAVAATVEEMSAEMREIGMRPLDTKREPKESAQ